jgi:hypothetical protein
MPISWRSCRAVDALDVVGGRGQLEHVGMGGDDAADGVDLFEGLARRLGRGLGGGHIDRPELAADAAGPQARNVGVQPVEASRFVVRSTA